MKSTKKIIHVNKHHIAMNAKDGGKRPVCTIKIGGKTLYGRNVQIHGPSEVCAEKGQLSCGARVWIETYSDITIDDEMTFKEAHMYGI